jgi:TrpR-related protein YerC/YecD
MSKSKIKSLELDTLIEAFLNIKDKDTWYKVLEDLCTIQEIKDLSLRYDVALKLAEGLSYQAISEKTKASSTTISRVAKALGYGEGGYQSMMKKKTT